MTQIALALKPSAILDAISGTFSDLALAYKKRQATNATFAELNNLTDKELRDIGISRGEIYTIARQAGENV